MSVLDKVRASAGQVTTRAKRHGRARRAGAVTRGRRRAQRRLAFAAALAGSAVSGAAIALRVRRRGSRRAGSDGATWRCACGQAFRVSGIERHRIYWLAEAPEDDPVVSGRCPNCDRALPAGAAGS